MKIAIACDHGGYLLKQEILIWMEENDIDFDDFGCFSTESVDYPVFAEKAARAVADGECEKGIVICTTGIGISIAANKVPGIRCALITGGNLAKRMVDIFLHTEFEGGRHARRVAQLDAIR